MPCWGCSCRLPIRLVPLQPERSNRASDVLQGEIAQSVKSGLESSLDCVAHGARNDDPTRGCRRFKSSGDVYIVTKDIIAFNDDITKVNANPKNDCLFLRLIAICISHGLLEFNGRP